MFLRWEIKYWPIMVITLVTLIIVNPNMHKLRCADRSAPLELPPEWGAL